MLQEHAKVGLGGLRDVSQAPKSRAHPTPFAQRAAVLRLRKALPTWGARKDFLKRNRARLRRRQSVSPLGPDTVGHDNASPRRDRPCGGQPACSDEFGCGAGLVAALLRFHGSRTRRPLACGASGEKRIDTDVPGQKFHPCHRLQAPKTVTTPLNDALRWWPAGAGLRGGAAASSPSRHCADRHTRDLGRRHHRRSALDVDQVVSYHAWRRIRSSKRHHFSSRVLPINRRIGRPFA